LTVDDDGTDVTELDTGRRMQVQPCVPMFEVVPLEPAGQELITVLEGIEEIGNFWWYFRERNCASE